MWYSRLTKDLLKCWNTEITMTPVLREWGILPTRLEWDIAGFILVGRRIEFLDLIQEF